MANQRRLIDQAMPTAYHVGNLWHDLLAQPLPSLIDVFGMAFPVFGISGHVDQGVPIQPRVHRLEWTLFRKVTQPLSVGAGAADGCSCRVGNVVLARGHCKAHGKALDIPLPGRRQCLVKVIDIEDQIPLGRAKEAKVEQMAIPTGLDPYAARRGRRQVSRHQPGRPA